MEKEIKYTNVFKEDIKSNEGKEKEPDANKEANAHSHAYANEDEELEINENHKKFNSYKKNSINLYTKLTSMASVSNYNLLSIGDISGKISLYDNRVNKVTKLFLSENKVEIK